MYIIIIVELATAEQIVVSWWGTGHSPALYHLKISTIRSCASHKKQQMDKIHVQIKRHDMPIILWSLDNYSIASSIPSIRFNAAY